MIVKGDHDLPLTAIVDQHLPGKIDPDTSRVQQQGRPERGISDRHYPGGPEVSAYGCGVFGVIDLRHHATLAISTEGSKEIGINRVHITRFDACNIRPNHVWLLRIAARALIIVVLTGDEHSWEGE